MKETKGKKEFDKLCKQAKDCSICVMELPDGVNPVFSIHPKSKILIIGQAPGRVVHLSGKPWADASGKRLRAWLDVSEDEFYNPEIFGIIPMGFCFPGSKKGGDLPPRPECAPKWHEPMLRMMPDVKLILLFGQYAQKYYLGKERKKTLTETVMNWKAYLPKYMPLPHPSPRNNIWLKKNEWFEDEIVPFLREEVNKARL